MNLLYWAGNLHYGHRKPEEHILEKLLLSCADGPGKIYEGPSWPGQYIAYACCQEHVDGFAQQVYKAEKAS